MEFCLSDRIDKFKARSLQRNWGGGGRGLSKLTRGPRLNIKGTGSGFGRQKSDHSRAAKHSLRMAKQVGHEMIRRIKGKESPGF